MLYFSLPCVVHVGIDTKIIITDTGIIDIDSMNSLSTLGVVILPPGTTVIVLTGDRRIDYRDRSIDCRDMITDCRDMRNDSRDRSTDCRDRSIDYRDMRTDCRDNNLAFCNSSLDSRNKVILTLGTVALTHGQ
jgi:hypothetical protein